MNIIKNFIYTTIIPFFGKIFRAKNQYINVIYYHDIVREGREGYSFMKIPQELFKEQMNYIKKMGYKTFTFDELSNEICAERREDGLLITFDDGWESNYSVIFDFMKSLGLKYNIFLEVGKIGMDPRYLSWEQIREMHTSGLVGFGAHTYTHKDLSNIKGIDLSHEIHDANSRIMEEIGQDVKDFCFPYGRCSIESIDAIMQEKTYNRIYTSRLDYSYKKDECIIFGRNGINCDESSKIFQNKVAGYYNAFYYIKRMFRRS